MKLGFIGFGEAAQNIAKGLKNEKKDIQITAYDVAFKDEKFKAKIKDNFKYLNITLCVSLKELIDNNVLIIVATSAKTAAQISYDCYDFLTSKHIYVDINATSPDIQKEIANVINSRRSFFVDAAVMGVIPKLNHKVPMLISGDGSDAFLEFGEKYNMNLEKIDINPGTSSGVKMARSIFMKGFTTTLIETLKAASSLNMENKVLNSINESLGIKDLEHLSNNLISRTVMHSERRSAEMVEVIKTFEKHNVEMIMAKATQKSLDYLTECNLKDYFSSTPNNYKDVIKKIRERENDDSYF